MPKTHGASALVNELSLSKLHKNILIAYIDVYQGDFSKAKQALQLLSPETLADKRTMKQIAQQINDEQTEAERLNSAINGYLFSEVTSNVCNSGIMTEHSRYPKGGPFVTASDFQHYVENVTKSNTLTPLNPQVMDLVFHVTMLGGDYKSTELVGDSIIRAKGNIKVPFLSSDSYFWVKIDGKNRRISTEPNLDEKFMVAADYPALLPTDYTPLSAFHALRIPHHASQARWYEHEEPFDLSLDEITSIEQRAKDWRGGLQGKAYAMKITPKGLAPNYVGMNVLACVFGEEAQRRATRNLGMFIQHVAAPHIIQANLVDPSKHTVDIWGEGQFGSMIAGMYGATAARTGSASEMAMASVISRSAATEEASKQEYDSAQKSLSIKWFAEMQAIGDTFKENQNMVEVEKLLQLQ